MDTLNSSNILLAVLIASFIFLFNFKYFFHVLKNKIENIFSTIFILNISIRVWLFFLIVCYGNVCQNIKIVVNVQKISLT